MVENFQRFFEQKDFNFSREDEELKQQLLGYGAPRQSAKGFPIYKADPEFGDHDLDAVMLALFGFNQEMSPEFRKKDYLMDFGFVPYEHLKQPALPDPMSSPLDYEIAKERMEEERVVRPGKYEVPGREISKSNQLKVLLDQQMVTINIKQPKTRKGWGSRPKSRTAFLRKRRRASGRRI